MHCSTSLASRPVACRRTFSQPTLAEPLTAELASSFDSATVSAKLTLTIDCPSLPEAIYVDREMWEKIVLNLVSNAFKHTFQGGIAVRLAWVDGSAQLTVEDSGVGIAADEIPRLFERFHRVKGAASRTHEGSGIGLSLVRDLVKLHSGSVRVESELGKGTRFIVTLKAGTAHLPADQVDQSDDGAPAGRTAAAHVNEARSWLPSASDTTVTMALPQHGDLRPRILLADDNVDMRRHITRLLRRSYEVLAVADGEAALEAALANPPIWCCRM